VVINVENAGSGAGSAACSVGTTKRSTSRAS
jgi:hypothetical protein